jgi:diadenosine tetraphosphate (Ap4A) HIT family hydrolase
MEKCVLCNTTDSTEVVYRSAKWRVLLVDDDSWPGFCRVVLNGHVAEMTDLDYRQRTALMDVVWIVEQVVREVMQPDKVNLASLGNMVPHLHWHIIPRYRDDMTFPDAIWAPQKRVVLPDVLDARKKRLSELRHRLADRLILQFGESLTE